MSNIEDKINLISASIGSVTSKDIEMASVNKAKILGFNSKISATVRKLATTENIFFKDFLIIYHLFEYVDEMLEKTQTPPPPEETGQIKIEKIFNINNQIILGGVVTSGKITVGDTINNSKIVSLQSNKEKLNSVKKDQEFGLIVKPNLDIKEGEVIITYSNN